MPASTDNKALPTPLTPIDPARRAKAIRDAIARRKIKPSRVIDQKLSILDQIAMEEKKSA